MPPKPNVSLLDDTVIDENGGGFRQTVTIPDYTMVKSLEKEQVAASSTVAQKEEEEESKDAETVADSEIVVPSYKVAPHTKVQAKNSDMGSDGGYFSGAGEDPAELSNDAKNSDDDYADFEHQNIEDDADFIEDDFDVNEEDLEIQDSYLTSQFDFMYSSDSMNEEEIRQSFKQREKEFYGDDEQEEEKVVESYGDMSS